MAEDAESRLHRLGIVLPTPGAPGANFVPAVQSRGMLYISGQVPIGPDGVEFIGKIGRDFDVETGRQAARLCAINILAQAKAALASLERIGRVVKLTGFVNADPDFLEPHEVVNGASHLILEVLGERGRHARSAIAVASLPLGAAVEVEAIIEIA